MNNQALEERLAKLEARNRVQTLALYAVACCFLIFLFTGKTEAAPTAVQASRFELVDASGKQVGVWEATADGTRLVVARPDGSPAVKLAGNADVAGMTILDKDGIPRAITLLDHDLPSYVLLGKKKWEIAGSLSMTQTGPKVDLKDANGKLRARLGVAENDAYVELLDSAGKEVWGQRTP